MLTTGTRTRWWPVVNETTESKINKIKGKEIGSGHRTRGMTRPRDPIRSDSNAYPIRLNKNNNSPLIISYLSIDHDTRDSNLENDRFLRFTRSLHLSRSLPRFRRDLNRIPRLQQSSSSSSLNCTVHTVKLVPPRPVDGGETRFTKTRLIPITTIPPPLSLSPLQHFSRIFQWHLAGSRQTPCFLSTRWRSERGNRRNEGRGRKWRWKRNEMKERKKERSGGTDTGVFQRDERAALIKLPPWWKEGGARKGRESSQ